MTGCEDYQTVVADAFAGQPPDHTGHFGRFGGRFVPEALLAALSELTTAFLEARDDARFRRATRRGCPFSWRVMSCSPQVWS
ncbi:hypothetical protein [Saccharopolyspora spinosa]|uniref:Tryptophan synthase beta chain n=1 Tax=Saccharopolyspora spinosa TaxID=60894 RepID=A0A2N3XWJ0_SACSN|nr:hypothetical protein A8926_2717 [Saccharopolyspora spinosa]